MSMDMEIPYTILFPVVHLESFYSERSKVANKYVACKGYLINQDKETKG